PYRIVFQFKLFQGRGICKLYFVGEDVTPVCQLYYRGLVLEIRHDLLVGYLCSRAAFCWVEDDYFERHAPCFMRDHFAKLAPTDNAHADGPVHGNEVAVDHKLRVNWSRARL